MSRLLAATALALVAAPAAAQQDAPFCGGISLVGEWLGGDRDGSDVTGAEAAFDAEGTVPISGHLVRMFTLSAPTDIRAEVMGVPAGDPYFSIFDEGGAEVASDDDSGGDFAARVEDTLPAGTYCLAARSYDSGLADVAIRVGLQSHEAMTGGAATPEPTPEDAAAAGAPCDAPDVARLGDDLTVADLTEGVSLGGSSTAVPGRAFTLAEPSPITITATSDLADPLIRLRDADGTQLAENDDADGLDSRIDLTTPLAAGAYCLEVEDLNDGTEDIAVTLTAFDAAADRRARLDRAEFTPGPSDDVAIAEAGIVQDSVIYDLTASGDASWLRLTVPEGGLLIVEAIGADVDPTVTLFDRVGRRLGENDDGPGGLDSFLAMRVLPGEYLLAVRLVDESSTGPVRILLERFVPAQ